MVLTALPLNIIECHSFICLQIRSQWHYTWECVHLVVCLWQRSQTYGLWPRFGPRAVAKSSYQFSASLPRHCESALSEAVLPINKWAEMQLPQLPTHRASRLWDGKSPWYVQEDVTCYANERKIMREGEREMLQWNPKQTDLEKRKKKEKKPSAWKSGSVNFNTYSALKHSWNSGQISFTALVLISSSVK